MILESREIQLDRIDYSNKWNLHPWELYTLSEGLASSFSRTGILHPPILLAREDNRFDIVCGCKRLLFIASLAMTPETPCLVLAKHTDPTVILDVALTDQSLGRPLSVMEKARFIEIASHYLPQQEIVAVFSDRLAIDRRPSTVSALVTMLRQPPRFIAEAHCGTLPEKIVMELLRLPAETDRVALAKLFKRLGMGEGKQKKFLPLIRDLALRNEVSIAALLEQASIATILDHPDMNNPQKIHHLATFLQQQLNPSATHAEMEFIRKIKSLQLPENCTIGHSPSFEKEEVTFSITFKNLAECRDWLPTLSDSRS